MNLSRFSKKNFCEILDVINATVCCKTEQDVVQLTQKMKELVCADMGICVLGDIKNATITKYLNLNYPKEWEEQYSTEKLYKVDPIIHFNFTYPNTSHFWSEALNFFPEEPYKDFMNMASEFGLNFGLTSNVNKLEMNETTIISFANDMNSFNSHHKKILDILAPHVHQALLQVSEETTSKAQNFPALTLREKEVLNWIKDGKTNWETSVILNISERTVKFHVQNVLSKLDSVSKTQAVAVAMSHKLIA